MSHFNDIEPVAISGGRQDRCDFVRFFFAAADNATDARLSYDEIVFGETFVSKLRPTRIGIRPANSSSCERDCQMAFFTLGWPTGITRKRKHGAEASCSTCPHA